MSSDPAKQSTTIAQTILSLAAVRYPNSICPSEVARAISKDERQWRALMPEIREQARELARDHRLLVTQRGHALATEAPYRGAIRLVLFAKGLKSP